MEQPSLEERYAHVQRDLAGRGDAALLDRRLSTWVISTDRHLPQAFLGRMLREVVALNYDHLLETPGMGSRRIEKLIDVLERASREPGAQSSPAPSIAPTPSMNGVPAVMAQPIAPDKLTEPDWLVWRHAILAHGLQREHLGRFARSLSDLPQGLWTVPLSEYAEKPLYEIRSMQGHGPARVGVVLEVFSQIAQTIAGCPTEAPLAVRLLPPLVRDSVVWAEEVLHDGSVPDVQSIRVGFLSPLFKLLETDLGADTAAMVRRRIGLDGPAETLEQVAIDVGLTRERVRQITAKAAQVIRVRWPEGKFILDNVYALLQAAPDAEEQLDLMHTVLDACFALEVTRGGSRSDVLAAWDRAGRAKRTPMSEAGVRTWASEEFPDLPSDVIRRWFEEEGLRHVEPGGDVLFFSNDPLDRLLLHLHTHPEPVSVSELPDFVDGDGRNLRNRVDRDPRFIEDEFKRVLPVERCSFFRHDGRWFMRLEPLVSGGAERRAEAIAVSELVHLIVGGLVQSGICDATVWGVHRFTATLLKRVYAAAISPAVTPFILASTLTRHSDGLVRTMRRRRLRWDSADGSVPVRGKRGWVDHVATTVGVPITLDELDTHLRGFFQDYESYVLQQLNLDEDEEGVDSYGCRFVTGVPNRIPAILIPRGWELDSARQNVSEGIRMLVTRIVAASSGTAYRKVHLRRVPWLVQLCEHAAFGQMRWNERPATAEDDIPAEEPAPDQAETPRTEETPPAKADDMAASVEDLLSRFL